MESNSGRQVKQNTTVIFHILLDGYTYTHVHTMYLYVYVLYVIKNTPKPNPSAQNVLSKQNRSISVPFYSMERIAIAKFNLKFSLQLKISVADACGVGIA